MKLNKARCLLSNSHISSIVTRNCKFHWKSQCIMCVLLIACMQNFYTVCNAAGTRIERRFMWKEMDMNGLLGGMKNMFGDLMQSKQTKSSILDYLPSETTRVKYIIHSPTSKKPINIIKIRPSKKIVKVMTTPKTYMEQHSIHNVQGKVNYLSIEEMHKLEKEQEMIAEGRLPLKSDKDTYNKLTAAKSSTKPIQHEIFDIVKGTAVPSDNGWFPVYKTAVQQTDFRTSKPHVMSELHTSITDELLPRPEKQVYESFNTENGGQETPEASLLQHYYEPPLRSHTYEVTENTAEETRPVQITQDYSNNTRGGFSSLYKHRSNAGSLSPSMSSKAFMLNKTTPKPDVELPNYPLAYLQRHREKFMPSTNSSARTSPHLEGESVLDSAWKPIGSGSSVTKLRLRQPKVQVKTEIWPVQSSQLPEIITTASEIVNKGTAQQDLQPTRTVKLNTRRKHPIHVTTLSQSQDTNENVSELRNRGTIRFGDKLASLN